MSFTQSTFAPVASNSTDSPGFWTYKTEDNSTDVSQINYFIDKINQLETGDMLYLFCADGFFVGFFENIAGVISVPKLMFISEYMPVAPEGDPYVGEGALWTRAVTTATSNTYSWSEDTNATDPTPSFVKINNTDEALATEVYVNVTTLSGGSAESIMQEAVVGDLVRIQQFGVTGNFMTAKIEAAPIDNGGWWTVPVDVIENGGGFVADIDVSLDFWPTGLRAEFDYLEDETENITASTTFVTKLSMNTSNLKAGDYLLNWAYSISGLLNNDQQEVRVTIDGVDFADCDSFNRFANSYSCTSSFKIATLTDGVHVINIDYRAVSGSAKIKGVRLKLDKLP